MELILNTFGTYLTRKNEIFCVIHKDGKQNIHPKNIKSISISRGAQISSDAALLAIANEIDVYFIDRTGEPAGRIWSNRFGSVSTIRHKQLEFCFSQNAIKLVKKILQEKIDNQVALLYAYEIEDDVIMRKISTICNRLEDYKTKIKNIEGEVISDIAHTLRGWEGASSRNYFKGINYLIPKRYQFEVRTKHPALDAFNALLNYGYGILYGKIEGALIRAGIDPYIGIFHRDDYNRPVLVYDIIEKYRVWIDYVVVNLTRQEVINEDCFSVQNDGSYWLEGLGKRILIQSVNDYFDEVISIDELNRSRVNHISLFAQKLAQDFLKYK